jgi:hypothetical protein
MTSHGNINKKQEQIYVEDVHKGTEIISCRPVGYLFFAITTVRMEIECHRK